MNLVDYILDELYNQRVSLSEAISIIESIRIEVNDRLVNNTSSDDERVVLISDLNYLRTVSDMLKNLNQT